MKEGHFLKAIDEAAVRRRLARDGKLQVIRFVMQEMGVGLSEAKQYVESLLEQRDHPVQTEMPTQNSAQPDESIVYSFLVRGEKLQAIQFVMKETGMSLSEAKNYVEARACKVNREKHQAAKDEMAPVKEHRGDKVLLVSTIIIVLALGIILLMNLDKLF